MPNAAPRSCSPLAALFALACAAGAVIGFLSLRQPPPESPPDDDDVVRGDPAPPDPRTTFQTNFRNVQPSVKFVGDTRCVTCHERIDKTFHAHPMGRSADFVSASPSLEKFDSGSRPSFTQGPYSLGTERTASGFTHHMSLAAGPDYAMAAHLAIGSGTRGRSYLSLQSGTVWQTPISWFTSKNQWDVSPGFDLDDGGRRAIVAECLFCHVDRVEPVRGSVNRYREPLLPVQASIGCERCHGPGELHVAERMQSQLPGKVIDTSIVNPRHLPRELQTAICAQCHLQGQQRVLRRGRELHEFRPGLPLEAFVTVFTRHPNLIDWHRSVGQFEQMQRSACFTATGGKLGCTSCHDPHERPAEAEKDAYFRARCRTCHENGSKPCSAPPSDRTRRRDACTACHMPSTGSSNIAHASVTDHRIVRRPSASPPPFGLGPGLSPLVRFTTGPYVLDDAELERDSGIALARLAASSSPHAPRNSLAALAKDRLESSLKTWRGDASGWLAMGHARQTLGEISEARRAAANALTLEPEWEAALGVGADLALTAGQYLEAERLATKLIAMASTDPDALVLRALAFVGLEEWSKGEADCRAALAIHPLHLRARLALAVCRHRQGDAEGGRAEVTMASKLLTDPRRREAALDWYRSKTR